MRIKNKEWMFVLLFSALIISLTFIPIIFGYARQTDGYSFMGLTHVLDSNTYFDYMNQARDGHFLFINSYTSEAMEPFLIRPLFWFMGLFTLFLPQVFVWHLFRVLLSFAFCFAAYYLISMILTTIKQRRIAFIILLTSSGFGWLAKIVEAVTGKLYGGGVDFKQSAITFLTLEGQPHTIASIFLMTLTYILFLKAYQKKDSWMYLLSGISGLLLGFIHIFDLITVICVTAAFIIVMFLIKSKFSWKPIVFYLPMAIPLIYYASLSLTNTIFKAWSSQNIIESPNPWGYLLGYGLLGVFALVYFLKWYSYKGLKKENPAIILLFVWIFVNCLLLYSPLKIEARFVEGLHIPVAIIASMGLISILKNKKIVIAAVIILMSFSNIYYMAHLINEVRPDYRPTSEYANRYYLSLDELDALSWLKDNTNNELVVADYHLSNYIPRIAGNRVYLGHWAQTIELDAKKQELEAYYSGTGKIPDINEPFYVIFPSNTDSALTKGLKLAYKNPQLEIYSR